VVGKEPGFEAIAPFLLDAACSANIVAEVVAKLTEWGWQTAAILEALGHLDLEVHAVTAADAVEIGLLRSTTRAAGLSLGDRSCLALAARLGLPAVTTDRAWAKVADRIGVEVLIIR
jgi:PIN domain nuclease of toxin-antitoxin system